MEHIAPLKELAKRLRHNSVLSTSTAGSGHPSSSLSAADLMSALCFGGFFKARLHEPEFANNDRLIFSKGHASPLFYALYEVAGAISTDELKDLRKFSSNLEGHPTMRFPYTEAATGSLGQGLSVGVGMALNAKLFDKLPYKTFVLLGDSEMAEGSVWEAIQLASHYNLSNLIAILDVNRLGQRGETMIGHDTGAYANRVASFGWTTITIDGHDMTAIVDAFEEATKSQRPVMIIAKTIKGKGISFIEDQDGWHGKAIPQDQLEAALTEIGDVDYSVSGQFAEPENLQPADRKSQTVKAVSYEFNELVATRKAYGNALRRLAPAYPELVVLDAEVSNSTFADGMKTVDSDRFIEVFIAEQNMVSIALGLSRRNKKPFISTFAAFFTRASDQIRMSQYSDAKITFVGSHAGVSIGEDGASQMGLEDISLFRCLNESTVLYPSDALSAEKLIEASVFNKGITYVRTTRQDTPVIYKNEDLFPIGGSKTIKQSAKDMVTVIGAGITLHEALAAYKELAEENIMIRVIDLYSIKPIDSATLHRAAKETQAVLTVEDHRPEGGLGEAVMAALASQPTPVYSLAVTKLPRSGKPAELLAYEEIDAQAIIAKVKELL